MLQRLKLYRPVSALTGSPTRGLNTSKRTLFLVFFLPTVVNYIVFFTSTCLGVY